MNRIYLLTGAAGLLGSNISRQLVDAGKTVRALVLKGDPAARYIPDAVQVVYGDLLDRSSLENLFTVPADSEVVVIHSASIVTLDPSPSPKVHAVNVDGTRNVTDLCERYGIRKFIYVSSVHAIPEKTGGRTIKETSRFSASYVKGAYGKSKAEAAAYVKKARGAWCKSNSYLAHFLKNIFGDIKHRLEF